MSFFLVSLKTGFSFSTEKPVKCGLIRKYDVPRDDNNCKSDRSINFGECYGGCDDEAELCCFGDKTAEKSAIMYCPDGTSFEKFVSLQTYLHNMNTYKHIHIQKYIHIETYTCTHLDIRIKGQVKNNHNAGNNCNVSCKYIQ